MYHEWGIIWHLFRGFSKKNQEIEKIKSIPNEHTGTCKAVFSYTLTGAVSIEMTKNVVTVKSLFMKGSALGVHTLCIFLFFFP